MTAGNAVKPSLQRAEEDVHNLAHSTHASLFNFFPPMGFPADRTGLEFESLCLSLVFKLGKLVLDFPNRIRLENIKLLECGSKGNKEYTETGSLGESLLHHFR